MTGLFLPDSATVKHRGYEMKDRIDEHIEFHEANDKHKSDVEFLKNVKGYVGSQSDRIFGLSAKLDQAIDLLTIEQRAALLIEWGKSL